MNCGAVMPGKSFSELKCKMAKYINKNISIYFNDMCAQICLLNCSIGGQILQFCIKKYWRIVWVGCLRDLKNLSIVKIWWANKVSKIISNMKIKTGTVLFPIFDDMYKNIYIRRTNLIWGPFVINIAILMSNNIDESWGEDVCKILIWKNQLTVSKLTKCLVNKKKWDERENSFDVKTCCAAGCLWACDVTSRP